MEVWIGLGVLTVINIVGWLISANRYSKNEAMHLGKLEGAITGLAGRIGALEDRIGNMEQRMNGLMRGK